jgi:hypothetical protein
MANANVQGYPLSHFMLQRKINTSHRFGSVDVELFAEVLSFAPLITWSSDPPSFLDYGPAVAI